MTDSIMLSKLEKNMVFFKKMYDMVRLVDPIDKKVIEYRGCERQETSSVCYKYWKSGEICDNCISVRAHLFNKCFFKLEQSGDTIMMVTALPVENTEKPTVIELLKNATESMMISSDNGETIQIVVKEINDMVVKDELTGLYNRRYVDERLPADIVRSTLSRTPLSVIFMDIDNLKEINDTYGHIFGDKTLTEVTNVLLQCIDKHTGWAARYGGDEFLVCVSDTSGGAAYQLAEKIRVRIADMEILLHDKKVRTTVSLGICTMRDTALTAEEMISIADKRMYESKHHGKNYSVGINKHNE